ncbi:MAG: tRNA (adenosine(37)-N6)-threonylcarbamoyltransferase complex ATPase subunit type 1 TsaE [Planctomycetes bacterium]|nr:tRNA (adenosine(37)-N6)-threonylcarbamoyltransferase complex ATPase subunit type 1 TsaE [Planctomycetota bacterium]
MERRFKSLSAEATEEIGVRLGELLWGGVVLTLDGDLGAGKTTFVRGLARGLGIEDGVASPTYTLMQQHDGGRLPLYHFDAWMEGREKALLADGADEFLGHDGVSVVEWAGRVEGWLPSPRLSVELLHDSPETRWVILRTAGGEGGPVGALERLHGVLGALEVPGGAVESASADSGDPAEPSGRGRVEGP